MTSADRFVSPKVLPARGSIGVRNISDTLHFLSLVPVKPGTTDQEVQAFFDSGSTDFPHSSSTAPGRAGPALSAFAGQAGMDAADRHLPDALLHPR